MFIKELILINKKKIERNNIFIICFFLPNNLRGCFWKYHPKTNSLKSMKYEHISLRNN